MAANLEKKVIEKLRVLPEDQQAEVLKFVEDLAGLGTKADTGTRPGPNRFFKWPARCACKVLRIGLLGLMIIFTAERNWMSDEFFLDTAYAIAFVCRVRPTPPTRRRTSRTIIGEPNAARNDAGCAAGNRKRIIEDALSSSRRRIVGCARTRPAS